MEPLHNQLFAFSKGTGTADNFAGLLSTVDDRPSVVVFLDLEKAFELVNPLTILEVLVQKGVQGRLIRWIRNYITDREIYVTFQDKESERYPLENGTPQGGILSPLLFNLVMEQLVLLNFERGVKLLCYANDLQLIVQGGRRVQKAQRALHQLNEKCKELGLKINPRKTKAIACKFLKPNQNLSIQETDIEWVNTHQCLGIFFDNRLTFKPHIEYLKEKMATRICVMRKMTGLYAGADYDVLRTYYIHAVRSLLDYSSPALAEVQSGRLQPVQVQQNKALRLIVGAPVWTKISNLQAETNIAPVEARITKNVASIAAKILSRPGYQTTRLRLKAAIAQGTPFTEKRWSRRVSNAMAVSGISFAATLGEDLPSENYVDPPPWRRTSTTFNCKLPDAPREN